MHKKKNKTDVYKYDQMMAYYSFQIKSTKWSKNLFPYFQFGKDEFSIITYKEHEKILLKLFYKMVAD